MTVRVLRLMEYTYDSLEQAETDMSHWYVQRFRKMGVNGPFVRSAVLVNPFAFEETGSPYAEIDEINKTLRNAGFDSPCAHIGVEQAIEQLKKKEAESNG